MAKRGDREKPPTPRASRPRGKLVRFRKKFQGGGGFLHRDMKLECGGIARLRRRLNAKHSFDGVARIPVSSPLLRTDFE